MVSKGDKNADPSEEMHWPVDNEGYLLLQEVHHRLMNTMTILASQIRGELGSPVRAREGDGREWERLIRAHSELHRFLALGAMGDPAPIGDYVIELCGRLSEAILEPLGLRCVAIGDAGSAAAKQCERLGLIICELVLNAAKHAFPHGQPGLIRVELSERQAGWCCIVADNGCGATSNPGPAGLGARIVEALLLSVDGSMVTRSTISGTIVAVTLRPQYRCDRRQDEPAPAIAPTLEHVRPRRFHFGRPDMF